MKSGGKFFQIVGKIVVFAIIAAIGITFALPSIKHRIFSEPEGIYAMDIESEEFGWENKMAITFSDGLMHVYRYQTSGFGDMVGIRCDYQYVAKSFVPLFGSVYLDSEPSILFWNNYNVYNQYTIDRAHMKFLLKGVKVLNAEEVITDEMKNTQSAFFEIRAKSIKLNNQVFNLISENDTTDYDLLKFDRECKDVQID